MRAREPEQEGYVERDGVRIFYEVIGSGEPTVLLLPTWSIIHSRFWKAQVPYLARHCRVVTFDGRGNGRSSRPERAAAYANAEFVADALAVLDATGTERATARLAIPRSAVGGVACRRALRAGRRRCLHRPWHPVGANAPRTDGLFISMSRWRRSRAGPRKIATIG